MTPFSPLTDEEVEALAQGSFFMRDGLFGESAAAMARALRRFTRGRTHPAGIGRGANHRIDPNLRSDQLTWLEPGNVDPHLDALHQLFDQIRLELNQTCYLGLRRFTVQVAVFPAHTAGYARHLDTHRGDQRRVATAIWYANPGWQAEHGGELEVFPPEGPAQRVLPTLDRLVVFRSECLPHAVRATHRRPRLAAAAWFHGREDAPLLPDA
jgi:SM-20-related protein